MSGNNYGLDPDHPTTNPAVRSADAEGHVDPALEFVGDTAHPVGAAAFLRTTQAVRSRAAALLARARAGESEWFTIGDDEALEDTARTVAEVTRDRYAWGPIPYHSRWRHFEAGGVNRVAALDQLLGDVSARQRARAHLDLVLVSVLLDAGAGADWHYFEATSGQRFTRSEGLGVASFHAFTSGLFSSDPAHPLQADAAGLRALVTDRLGDAFQVSTVNPLVGLAGRATLLRRLGEAMNERPEVFGDEGRPGGLFDALIGPYGPAAPPTAETTAHEILSLLLESLSATRRWRWATAGATARCAGPASPTAGCPSTSCRSGSPTRCSSLSNGPVSRCAMSRPSPRCPSTATAAC